MPMRVLRGLLVGLFCGAVTGAVPGLLLGVGEMALGSDGSQASKLVAMVWLVALSAGIGGIVGLAISLFPALVLSLLPRRTSEPQARMIAAVCSVIGAVGVFLLVARGAPLRGGDFEVFIVFAAVCAIWGAAMGPWVVHE